MTRTLVTLLAASVLGAAARPTLAQLDKADFSPFEEVSKDFEPVNSTADRADTFWTVYYRAKDGQLLAELPKSFEGKRFTIVPTVAAGDEQAGVYSIWNHLVGRPAALHEWRRFGNQLALMEPNLDDRTRGDDQSKAATSRVFTDRVLLSTPIVSVGPGGGPVIDLDQVLLNQSGSFFGPFTRGANLGLVSVDKVKAFPYNTEVAFSFPRAGGQMATIHYSIGAPPPSKGYTPREADRRVGFYYVNFNDRAKNDGESQVIRYANRWNLEKADPKLKLSPPKQPIVYYIEHTTPVRYRRWVRDGILAWNRAFEQVGILGAIEVRQQDAASGAHMDKDPEDIRYSFVRWTNSDMGFAIGPVHVHPETGEIYEADIVMDEGFLSSWARAHLSSRLAKAAMLGLDAETVSWLDQNPQWDPRVRLTTPNERGEVNAYLRSRELGEEPTSLPPTFRPDVWSAPNPEIAGVGASCACLAEHASSVAMMRVALDAGLIPMGEEGDESLLDGLPESFVGPLLKGVIMHEVGHTLGLMHNWKGSSSYEFADINSEEFRGTKTMSGTVMDYLPVNIVVEDGKLVQGDLDTIDIGPYDLWAIRWGYTSSDPAEIAKLSAEPGHAFMAEDGASGPDPHAKTWDIGENSLDFVDAQMDFVHHARATFIDEAIKDGQSWKKAGELYGALLFTQLRSLSVASHWIGGAHVSRSFKGDPDAPAPITPVDVERQRRALRFIIDNAFTEQAFGLSPELLSRFVPDNWYDEGYSDPQDWPMHDRVLGVQASALTLILNPTRLRRVEDNLARTPAGRDALTVPEVLQAVRGAVWSELDHANGGYTNRSPMISGMRRNLQREHLDRLIALSTGARWPNASANTVTTLARDELRAVNSTLGTALQAEGLDDYSRAHLTDAAERIDRALEAIYIRAD